MNRWQSVWKSWPERAGDGEVARGGGCTQGPVSGWDPVLCLGLNVCILLKLLGWNPNAQGSGVRRWSLGRCLGHDSRALMNGVRAFIREGPQSSLPLLPCEHREDASCEPGKGCPGWCPDLRPFGLQTERNKCLLFISHLVNMCFL